MDVLFSRCAGLDVHKDLVVACVRSVQDDTPIHEIRSLRFADLAHPRLRCPRRERVESLRSRVT